MVTAVTISPFKYSFMQSVDINTCMSTTYTILYSISTPQRSHGHSCDRDHF